MPEKIRLDQYLVKRGTYETRARARDAIVRGAVMVSGRVAKKSGMLVNEMDEISCDDPAIAYVSRAALKLKAGLSHFNIDPSGKTALDIGASTGGFCQILLEQGAKHVIAVDVGHGQLHESLRRDPRLTNLEGLNARELSAGHLSPHCIDLIVSDVSFISLKLALPQALSLARDGAFAVLLVKPQFEAGREAIGKGGLLKDPTQGMTIARDLLNWLDEQPSWSKIDFIASPITGGDGNQEFLIAGQKRKTM